MAMGGNVRRRPQRQPVSASRRILAVASRLRGLAGAVLGAQIVLLAQAALPSPSAAGCNMIPEPPVVFVGQRGSIDRGFIAPGDTIRVTIDTPDEAATRSAAAVDVDHLNVRVLVKPLTKGGSAQPS